MSEPVCIQLPPAKSEAIRALSFDFLDANTAGETALSHKLQLHWPEDMLVMHQALQGLLQGQSILHLKEAGTPARIILALASAFARNTTTLTAADSLERRPFAELIQVLRQWGANISLSASSTGWPMTIQPAELTLTPVTMSMGRSSQFASALALLAFGLQQPLDLQWHDEPVSLSYLALTLSMIQERGLEVNLRPNQLTVQPSRSNPIHSTSVWSSDWSSAAFFAVARMWLPKEQDLLLEGLTLESQHPDRKILDWLADFGLQASQEPDGLRLSRREAALVPPSSYDLKNCPDLVPAFAVFLAVTARQPILLSGVGHLAHKESNRLVAIHQNLQLIGGKLIPEGEDAWLHPCTGPLPSTLNILTAHDHRILMAFAPLSLLGIILQPDDMSCVRKSFPFFHREWAKLCPQWQATPSE